MPLINWVKNNALSPQVGVLLLRKRRASGPTNQWREGGGGLTDRWEPNAPPPPPQGRTDGLKGVAKKNAQRCSAKT